MTAEETQKFYEGDKNKYIIDKNNEFLIWYRAQLKTGYEPLLDLEELQDLVTKIKSWYELKYSEQFFGPFDNYQEELKISKLSETFTMEKFKKALTDREIMTLDAPYRKRNKIVPNNELETETIRINNLDISLRERILKMSASALLYSQDTVPENAIKRVKLMLNDFNKEYNLNISSSMYELRIAKAKSEAVTSEPIRRVITPTIYKPNKDVLTKKKKKRK